MADKPADAPGLPSPTRPTPSGGQTAMEAPKPQAQQPPAAGTASTHFTQPSTAGAATPAASSHANLRSHPSGQEPAHTSTSYQAGIPAKQPQQQPTSQSSASSNARFSAADVNLSTAVLARHASSASYQSAAEDLPAEARSTAEEPGAHQQPVAERTQPLRASLQDLAASMQGGGRPPARQASIGATGWQSRDSSPGRGSEFAFHGTQSGPNSVVSMSIATRKNYTAGPRSFTKTNMRRPGLETGDVVSFLSEGKAYVVSAAGIDDESGKSHYVLDLPQTASSPDSRESYLEVIRQGAWVGFRSSLAEDRFLQARRKVGQRLAFYNTNFGTWEQWELVQGEPQAPWDLLRLGFRNRRLPQFVLTVDVMRVGTYAVLPNSYLTPRSFIPSDGDISENAELQKISGLMIQEWFHFVDKEKAIRVRLEVKISQLMEEALELRSWTIAQVEAIRREMHLEINQLVDVIQHKNAQLADLEERLTNRLRWGILLLQAKNENAIRRQVLSWWRSVASYNRKCAIKVRRQLSRSRQMAVITAFDAWLDYTQYCRELRLRLRQAVNRIAHLKLATAFLGWAEVLAAGRHMRVEWQAVEGQACSRMAKRRLLAMLHGWRQHVLQCHRQQRNMRVLLNRSAHRHMDKAMLAWRVFLTTRKTRQHRVGVLTQRREAASLQACFHGWFQLVHSHSHGTTQLLQRCQSRLLRQAYSAWHEALDIQSARRDALAAACTRVVAARLKSALQEWRILAIDGQHYSYVVAVCQRRSERRSACVAFRSWQLLAAEADHRRTVLAHSMVRLCNRAMSSAFMAWQDSIQHRKDLRRVLDRHQAKRESNMLRAALAAWAGARSQWRRQQDVLLQCVVRMSQRLMGQAFGSWQEAVAQRAADRLKVRRCINRVCLNRTASAFASWHVAAAEQKALRGRLGKAVRYFANQRLAGAIMGWRDATQHQAAKRLCLQRAARLLQNATLAKAWGRWLQFHADLQRSRLVVARVAGRIANRLQAAAFSSWQAALQERDEQRQRLAKAVGRLANIRAYQAFSRWADVAAQRRAGKERLQAVVRKLMAGKQASAFYTWCDHVQQARRARAVGLRIVARLAQARLAAAFAAWQDRVEEGQRVRAACVKMVARMAHAQQAAAFAAWQDFVDTGRHQHQVMQRVAARLGQILLSRAFLQWASATRQLAEARRKVQRVVGRLQSASLAQAFEAWRAFVDDQKHKQAAATKVALRLHNALLARAFESWVQAVEEQREAALKLEAVARQQLLHQHSGSSGNPLLRCYLSTGAQAGLAVGFASWISYVEMCRRHRSILQRCLLRKTSSLQRMALVAWQSAASRRRRQEVAVARFRERWAAFAMRSGFERWHEAWQRRMKARERLRICITRKRISFRLFKQWYWESFDEDVQATLRQMFEATEDSINSPFPSSPIPSHIGSPLPALPAPLPFHLERMDTRSSAGFAPSQPGLGDRGRMDSNMALQQGGYGLDVLDRMQSSSSAAFGQAHGQTQTGAHMRPGQLFEADAHAVRRQQGYSTGQVEQRLPGGFAHSAQMRTSQLFEEGAFSPEAGAYPPPAWSHGPMEPIASGITGPLAGMYTSMTQAFSGRQDHQSSLRSSRASQELSRGTSSSYQLQSKAEETPREASPVRRSQANAAPGAWPHAEQERDQRQAPLYSSPPAAVSLRGFGSAQDMQSSQQAAARARQASPVAVHRYASTASDAGQRAAQLESTRASQGSQLSLQRYTSAASNAGEQQRASRRSYSSMQDEDLQASQSSAVGIGRYASMSSDVSELQEEAGQQRGSGGQMMHHTHAEYHISRNLLEPSSPPLQGSPVVGVGGNPNAKQAARQRRQAAMADADQHAGQVSHPNTGRSPRKSDTRASYEPEASPIRQPSRRSGEYEHQAAGQQQQHVTVSSTYIKREASSVEYAYAASAGGHPIKREASGAETAYSAPASGQQAQQAEHEDSEAEAALAALKAMPAAPSHEAKLATSRMQQQKAAQPMLASPAYGRQASPASSATHKLAPEHWQRQDSGVPQGDLIAASHGAASPGMSPGMSPALFPASPPIHFSNSPDRRNLSRTAQRQGMQFFNPSFETGYPDSD